MLILRWRDWLSSFERERRRFARRHRFQPRLERLEDRWAPATLTVTNTDDTGAGSLRQAIEDSNSTAGVLDTIEFAIGGGGFQSIALLSALPTITDAVIIDGTTQTGFAGIPLIELDGTSAGAAANGLSITAGNSTVRGLIINRFDGSGIEISIGGQNQVEGNYIGIDKTGAVDLGNGRAGVAILNSGANTIGGSTALAGNVISGNGKAQVGFEAAGISISGAAASGNVVLGNYVGLNAAGDAIIANTRSGIEIVGAPNNTIGGTTGDERNVVSGNDNVGVAIYGSGATHNLVRGNFIGTDATGDVDLGNAFQGIYIGDGNKFTPAVLGVATNNTVGGLTTTPGTGAGNLISGNDNNGILINGGKENVVLGNLIGTDLGGSDDLGNAFSGVNVASSSDNTIGGANAQARNIISGNDNAGVTIYGTGAAQNLVQGNYVGTDASGKNALGNSQSGVFVGDGFFFGASGTATDTSIIGNVISANGTKGSDDGIEIVGGDRTLVQGNLIGTDVTGLVGLGNFTDGVQIANGKDNNGAVGNTIGGTAAAARNIIAANGKDGVRILGADSTANLVVGNYIGTDSTGLAGLGNSHEGVHIQNAPSNTIGGTTAAERNLISGNHQNGVLIEGSGSTANLVAGNFIGVDVTGTRKLGNFLDGVVIQDGAQRNSIGGNTQPSFAKGGLGNVISGNNFGDPGGGAGTGTGVVITGQFTKFNFVQGNFIGVDVNGSGALPNQGDGVAIADSASFNTIGGSGLEGNVISANTGNGVGIYNGAHRNSIQGNFVGSDSKGKGDDGLLGNTLSGVFIRGGHGNLIGGFADGEGNLIAYNHKNGVTVVNAKGFPAVDNPILRNSIFNNDGLGIDLRNDGVTPNDNLDPDSGPNDLQNFPFMITQLSDGVITTFQFQLRSTPKRTFLVQFFLNAGPDSPSGHGEGELFLGDLVVTTDNFGFVLDDVTFVAPPATGFITATATPFILVGGGDGGPPPSVLYLGTSEFSGLTDPVAPPSSPDDPGRDPLELTPFLPPPDPISRGATNGAAELDINNLFAENTERRFLQSLSDFDGGGGGSGEPRSALLGALFNGEIGGGLFDDFNGNGKLDAGELPLTGQIVYLDANDDGKLDDDEWWTITNKRGEYRFQNLPPGRYIVRPVTAYETTVSLLNKGYQVKRMPPMLTTAPVTGRQQTELTSQQRTVIDLNFTARVRPDVRPFTPINPVPDRTTPAGPQGRLDRQPEPSADQPVNAATETTAAADPSTPRE
jgi:hypothetical protein